MCGFWSLITKLLLAIPMPKSGIPTKALLTESTTKNRIMGKQLTAILKLLQSTVYELNTNEIADRFKKDPDTIGRALRDLRERGIVTNGETDYVNGKARLTWKLVDKDMDINAFDVKPRAEQYSITKDPEIRQALKSLLELIIAKL